MPAIKLTETQLAILAGLDAVGVASIATLADAASLKAHTVRYGFQSLLEQELVSPFCSIDPNALGYNSYIVYFSFQPSSAVKVDEALAKIIAHPNVSWLGELSGSFQYGCTVCAIDALHAMSLVSEISAKLAIPWDRKSVTQRTHLLFWPLKYFGSEGAPSLSIEYPMRAEPVVVDDLDHVILKLKSGDPTIAHSEIARISHQPVTTITYRIAQLVVKRVILGSWYAPNWDKLGMCHSEVSLVLKEISSRLVDELVSFGREARCCHFVVGGVGSWDFQFNILSRHPSEQQQFTAALWQRFGHAIDTVNISAYTRLLKYATYPFAERVSL